MSIFSRVQAALQARANQIADQFEDPKASLDYSLVKLEESRNLINRSLVEVSAARVRLENQRNALANAIGKYQSQAEAAIKAGRDDLARLVLERKQDANLRLGQMDENLAGLDRQVDTLKNSQTNLEYKIALFRSKKEELKAIYDSSHAQLQVREAVTGISNDLADAGSTIQRIEARILDMQSRAQAIDGLVNEGVLTEVFEVGGDDVDRQLSQISRQQAIEDELARLKGAGQLPEPKEEANKPPMLEG